ncbi:MAG: tetratricopeptide repeat protein [Eubacteriales bacterium]|nr:tetratricopeptide repeat protein [Eubacteriales bacterium]
MDKKNTDIEIKLEKLRHRMADGDFKMAMDICDKIDYFKMKDPILLQEGAVVYEKNKDYEKAERLLKRAYRYSPVQKRLLFDLSFICIESGNISDAILNYKEFCDNFPGDSRREILKFGILKRRGAKASQLIRILEDYLSTDMNEKWLYELALLYEEEENVEAVVLCVDKLISLFGITEYGYKALLLKQKYKPLSEEQKLLIESKINAKRKKEEVENKEKVKDYFIDENKKDIFTYDKEKTIHPEEIKQDIKEESLKSWNEYDKQNDIFKNLPKTNVGIEDTYIPDIDDFFNEQDESFSNAFIEEPVINENEEEKTKEEDLKEKEQIKEAYTHRRLSFNRLTDEEKKMKLSDLKFNMIIEALSRDKCIQVATSELGYIREAQGIKRSIAKTSAYNINEKGFDYYKDKIENRDFIIENAGRLSDQSIDDIEEFVVNNDNKNIICLVDLVNNFDEIALRRPAFVDRFDVVSDLSKENKVEKEEQINFVQRNQTEREMPKKSFNNEKISEREKLVQEMFAKEQRERRELRREEKEIKPKVKQRVDDYEDKKIEKRENKKPIEKEHIQNDVEMKDIESFANVCRKYAQSIDCVIPGKSMPALYAKIEKMKKMGLSLSREEAINLIERAADLAEKPKFGFSKKYDKNDCLILKEEHLK